MTHSELVQVAAAWLRAQGCVLVFTEMSGWLRDEVPDVLGFHPNGVSVLVEVKVSITDVRANRRKGGVKYGERRWLVLPADVGNALSRDDLAPFDGWGVAIFDAPRPTAYDILRDVAIAPVQSPDAGFLVQRLIEASAVRRAEDAVVAAARDAVELGGDEAMQTLRAAVTRLGNGPKRRRLG